MGHPMGKSILLINGSPRKKGRTNHLLEIFRNSIQKMNEDQGNSNTHKISVEIIHLVDKKIAHCNACDSCLRKPHECPLSLQDDMGQLDKLMIESDAIVIGSPSYFANVTGIVKDLIDRSRPLKMAKYKLQNKYFSPLVTSGLQAGGLNSVQNSLIQYALIQGMVVIGALGHPVLMSNLPSEAGQKSELKEFRPTNEISNVARANTEALAKRFWEIMQ